MCIRVFHGLIQAYTYTGFDLLQYSCRPSLRLPRHRQLYAASTSCFQSGGVNQDRTEKDRPWWRAAAAVTAAGAAVVSTTTAFSPALADSSSMQMQQTKASDSAAKNAQYRSSSSSSGSGDEYLSFDDSSDSPLGTVLQYFSDATGYATDMVQDLFQHAETRVSGLLQQPSDEPVAARLVAFAAALLPVILASGLAYKYASGSSLANALYKMYCLLIRVEAGPEPNFWSYLVTNIVFLVGFFTLAVLLGVVNDEVQKRADDHRHGRNPVKASDHILILNWNENTPALLQNIAVAIASAGAADGAAGWHRRGGPVAGGLRGDLWGKNPAVVLLADKDKAEMDAAVQETVRDRGFDLIVHTRSGHPFKPSQLKKVSAHEAAIVVLLHPDNALSPADAEALKAAAAMAFTTLPARDGKNHHRHHKQQRMVVQMPASVPASGNVLRSVQNTSADASGGGGNLRVQVLSLPDKLLTNRLVAQTAAQPGLLTVWLDLLAPDATSPNFVCLQVPPDMEQLTYKDVRRSFLDDIVLGYIDQQGVVQLNPSDKCIPGPDSRLVLLTNGPGALSTARNRLDQQQASRQLFEHAAEAAAQRLRRGAGYKYQPRHIVVAAWADAHMHELMRSFAEFAPVGSTVTVISCMPPAKHWPKHLGNVSRFDFIQHAHPTSMEALQQAGIRNAACVVLGTGGGHPTDAEADARVLAALLQVQEAIKLLQLPQAPHVVAPICEAGSSSMALRYLDKLTEQQQGLQEQQQKTGLWGWRKQPDAVPVLKPEFLIFRNITSAVVAQAASEPSYADIVTALLFSKEGQEVYLRPPASFNIPLQQPISFAEIQELARKTNQTALGYISTNISQSAPDPAAEAASNSSSGGSTSGSNSNAVSEGKVSSIKRMLPWAHSVIAKLSRAATVHLGLSAADQVVLKDGDWIVVLAEDF